MKPSLRDNKVYENDEIGSSWQDAKKRNLHVYFTGRKCKFGHLALRRAISGNCSECMKTVHRGKINLRRMELNKKKGYEERWEIKNKINEKSREGAKNHKKKWDGNSISLILSSDEDNRYLLSTSELSNILGRTHRAIESARRNHKKELEPKKQATEVGYRSLRQIVNDLRLERDIANG